MSPPASPAPEGGQLKPALETGSNRPRAASGGRPAACPSPDRGVPAGSEPAYLAGGQGRRREAVAGRGRCPPARSQVQVAARATRMAGTRVGRSVQLLRRRRFLPARRASRVARRGGGQGSSSSASLPGELPPATSAGARPDPAPARQPRAPPRSYLSAPGERRASRPGARPATPPQPARLLPSPAAFGSARPRAAATRYPEPTDGGGGVGGENLAKSEPHFPPPLTRLPCFSAWSKARDAEGTTMGPRGFLTGPGRLSPVRSVSFLPW